MLLVHFVEHEKVCSAFVSHLSTFMKDYATLSPGGQKSQLNSKNQDWRRCPASRVWMEQEAGKQLFEASKSGRLEDVKKLLGQGAKPDAYRDEVCFLSWCVCQHVEHCICTRRAKSCMLSLQASQFSFIAQSPWDGLKEIMRNQWARIRWVGGWIDAAQTKEGKEMSSSCERTRGWTNNKKKMKRRRKNPTEAGRKTGEKKAAMRRRRGCERMIIWEKGENRRKRKKKRRKKRRRKRRKGGKRGRTRRWRNERSTRRRRKEGRRK